MARRNNRNAARVVKDERPRPEASSNPMGYPSDRNPRTTEERGKNYREVDLPRHALNDLYERSSI